MGEKALALRMAALWEKQSHGYALTPEAKTAAELRRLHAENDLLRQQHLEARRNSSTIFAALVEISLLTHLGGEVAEYGDVVDAVRRLKEEKAGLLEALRRIAKIGNQPYGTDYEEIDEAREIARAAIAKAEGEPK